MEECICGEKIPMNRWGEIIEEMQTEPENMFHRVSPAGQFLPAGRVTNRMLPAI
jgi:hypothetical protein